MFDHTHNSALLTADEFLEHPAARGPAELVRGHIRMMSPASGAHGLVSGTIFRLLANHVREHKLGMCFADSTGYALPNLLNTVRAPDASFVSANRLPSGGIASGFLQLAPDLAVEVLSPSESAHEIAQKLDDYQVAGTRTVWLIDPATRAVTVIRYGSAKETLSIADTLSGGDAVPGFSCNVAELFEGLAPTLC